VYTTTGVQRWGVTSRDVATRGEGDRTLFSDRLLRSQVPSAASQTEDARKWSDDDRLRCSRSGHERLLAVTMPEQKVGHDNVMSVQDEYDLTGLERDHRRTSGYASAGVHGVASSVESDVVVFKDDRYVTYRQPRRVPSDESLANYATSDAASRRFSPADDVIAHGSRPKKTTSPRDQQLMELGRLQERRDAIQEHVAQTESRLLGRMSVSCSGVTSPVAASKM
jgi:hypothetical protein